MQKLPFIVVLLFFCGCRKDPVLWEIKNLNNGEVLVFGHGGMGIHSSKPMNSQSSLKECFTSGADGCEVDLQMSADSVLFLFHNADLSESTGCEGRIHLMSASQIDCHYKDFNLKKEKVQRLDDVLAQFSGSGKLMTFDCKPGAAAGSRFKLTFAKTVFASIERYGYKQSVLIESSDPELLELFRLVDKELRLYFYAVEFNSAIETCLRLGLEGMTFDMKKITSGQINVAHQNGLRVSLFNQKSGEDNISALRMSPDQIQTDRLNHLLDVLEK